MLFLSLSSFLWAFGAAFIVSLLSFIGVIVLFRGKGTDSFPLYLLSLSAGGMLGGAFFHLLPEALADFEDPGTVFVYVLAGFLLFFMTEKILHWHHYHHGTHSNREHLGYINLFADSIHNFIDGLAIMASFAVSVPLGMAVTLAIIMHEIPQEIGDFGVLLYAGFQKSRAIFFNFVVALFALAGVVCGYVLLGFDINADRILLPFAAGSFIYIAAADLIPEINKENRKAQSLISFLVLIGALALMLYLKVIVR